MVQVTWRPEPQISRYSHLVGIEQSLVQSTWTLHELYYDSKRLEPCNCGCQVWIMQLWESGSRNWSRHGIKKQSSSSNSPRLQLSNGTSFEAIAALSVKLTIQKERPWLVRWECRSDFMTVIRVTVLLKPARVTVSQIWAQFSSANRAFWFDWHQSRDH